ncbi:hypothetical protein HZC31_00510 [Candidatus Woesearchaeota archaeon]|nr:hypothetical protein [Candidatus Woesearchaeota archaeon]
MKKIILIASVIFLVLLFPIYQLYALNSVEMQDFEITEVGMNRNLQFTIEGEGVLSNPSAIPVTIKEIRYVGTIKEETVLEGTIETIKIPAGETATFSLNDEIEWVPDQETMVLIVAGKNVTMDIKVDADASYLAFFTLTGHTEKSINIGKLARPYVEAQMAKVTDTLDALFG